MIKVTRLNGSTFFVNEDMIEFLEETPDTVITLNTEKKLIVKESINELIKEIIAFKQNVYKGDLTHLVETVEGEIK